MLTARLSLSVDHLQRGEAMKCELSGGVRESRMSRFYRCDRSANGDQLRASFSVTTLKTESS